MYYIKTYDIVGNISDATYIEDLLTGMLKKTKKIPLSWLTEVTEDPSTRRIYYVKDLNGGFNGISQ